MIKTGCANRRNAETAFLRELPRSRRGRQGKARADSPCILYRRRGTEKQSVRVHQALQRVISGVPADLQPVLRAAYRVLRTNIAHGDIPRLFGWRWLADITADLSDAASRPESG